MSLAKYYEDNEEIMLERIRNREYNLQAMQDWKAKADAVAETNASKRREVK